jgi:hypothetical protein
VHAAKSSCSSIRLCVSPFIRCMLKLGFNLSPDADVAFNPDHTLKWSLSFRHTTYMPPPTRCSMPIARVRKKCTMLSSKLKNTRQLTSIENMPSLYNRTKMDGVTFTNFVTRETYRYPDDQLKIHELLSVNGARVFVSNCSESTDITGRWIPVDVFLNATYEERMILQYCSQVFIYSPPAQAGGAARSKRCRNKRKSTSRTRRSKSTYKSRARRG